jgi:2,5-diketo-D-gluconate reductase B
MDSIPLNDKVNIPILGLGTWELHGDECIKVVTDALEIGYRHFDTADIYGNHKEIAKAMKSSGIPRDEIFITTKIWPGNLSKLDVLSAGRRFLSELETDYIDLLLIHWPNPKIPVRETLEAMNQLKKEEVIYAIGVSNFDIALLKEALDTGIEVSNNQIELHPSLNQYNLVNYCDNNEAVVTAYSPFARGEDLKISAINNLAEKYSKSPAQVVLNWIMQKGIVAIPKASGSNHLEENFKSLEWQLDEEDIKSIDTLNRDYKVVSN